MFCICSSTYTSRVLFDCSVCGVLPVRECINSKVTIVVCCLLVLFAACLFHCRLVCLSCLICLLFDCQDSLITYAEVVEMSFGEFACLICASRFLSSLFLSFLFHFCFIYSLTISGATSSGSSSSPLPSIDPQAPDSP